MAARKFLVPIDLTQLELQNARIQNLATAPSSPVSGQIYYNTGSNSLFYYNGTAWVTPSSSQIASGLLSARPTAATSGTNTFYYATDNTLMYYSDGSTWAQVDSFGSVTAQTTYGLSSGNGTATTYTRSDHTHGTPALSTNTPSAITIAGTGAAGSGTTPSKDDHTHAGPGFAAPTATTSYGLSAVTGTAVTVARADHTHGTPSLSTNAASNITATTATNGSGTAPAKDDHVHGFTPANFAISAFGAATADVSHGGFKITNLGDPSANSDAANKLYVDNVAQGLNIHAPAVAGTTATLASITGGTVTYANGTLGVGATLTFSVALTTLDGVTLANGDRILVKNEATQANNGVYTRTSSTVLTRATDFDNSTEIGGGDFVFVTSGTVLNNTGWVCIDQATTVGTTPIVFEQFSGAGTYTASNGVLLTGANFTFAPLTNGGLQTATGGASILLPTNSGLSTGATGLAVGAGTGITVTTGTVNIDTTVVARKYSTTLSTSATSYTVTHNLGTLDVHVQVYLVSDGSEVIVDNLRATTNTVTLNFSVAPSANAYRVVVIG